ncbi:hypothetical protein [Pelagibacterium sp.]|uniref:hypothetical protein n=1 Tax=Pelagibacterium sp. TaxID=1967288 RepID=UPI003A947497
MARLIFLAAAGLSLVNALLVMGSALVMTSGNVLVVSAVVALIFAAIALHIFMVSRYLTRVHQLTRIEVPAPQNTQLRAALGKLSLWLSFAALATGLVMAGALTGIVQRLGTGTAVFG